MAARGAACRHVGFFLLTGSDFPRITALLTTSGYSSEEAAEIIVFVRGKNAHARRWIEVLAGAGAARIRYHRALRLAFPRAA
jgi:hypothetical protein